MTVFITHCWKKRLERMLAMLVGSLLAASLALAGSIEPKTAVLAPDERGHALTVEFSIDLGPRLEDAVGRGVPLNFRLEFTLARKRWYWADEHVAGHVIDFRLSYHALTRQYRLSLGGLHRSFDTLAEALQVLERTARLHVVDRAQLIPGENYAAAARLSLDHTQLPKPLQLDALADREWRVEARTLRWNFVP
ncbi:MAG: DUF4390 domain-containing protein [Rhodocyclaceae bacterium]|nr:DUF4390 domain-containing protein [Rhodocyclaceae bacterium]